MNKRGQVYILVAIIFSFVIYLLASSVNTAKGSVLDYDFIEVSNNYDQESAKFLTSLGQEQINNPGINIETLFNRFAGKFTSYSSVINPSFGFIYFFDYSHKDDRKLIIGNHLDQEILVWVNDDNKISISGCKLKIPSKVSFGDLTSKFSSSLADILGSCSKTIVFSTNDNNYNVNYVVGNIKYTSSIIKGVPQIVILSEERNENERKVYTNHKFEKGESWVKELVIYCNNPLVRETMPVPIICDCSNENRQSEEGCLINDYCKWYEINMECINNE